MKKLIVFSIVLNALAFGQVAYADPRNGDDGKAPTKAEIEKKLKAADRERAAMKERMQDSKSQFKKDKHDFKASRRADKALKKQLNGIENSEEFAKDTTKKVLKLHEKVVDIANAPSETSPKTTSDHEKAVRSLLKDLLNEHSKINSKTLSYEKKGMLEDATKKILNDAEGILEADERLLSPTATASNAR